MSSPAPIKQLKNNSNLFASFVLKKNKNKNKRNIEINIVSSIRYQGYIKLIIFNNGILKKNIRYKKIEGYRDEFSSLADTLKHCDNTEELILILLAHNMGEELKRFNLSTDNHGILM